MSFPTMLTKHFPTWMTIQINFDPNVDTACVTKILSSYAFQYFRAYYTHILYIYILIFIYTHIILIHKDLLFTLNS